MSREDWDVQAKFMRDHGATAAEWCFSSGGVTVLTKLVLGPVPVVRPVSPAEPKPVPTRGIAASLMKQHEVQFAHSRVRPPMKLPGAESDVPRAVSAKRDVAHGRTKKAQKRAS
jgi:hypothetical protein